MAISSKDYELVARQSQLVGEWVGDKYSLCLLRCVEGVAQWLDEQQITDSIEYVFEAGGSHQEKAQAILSRIVDSERLQKRYHWDQYRFVAKGDGMPWFAAPDLLAWEWQRAHLNITKPERGERRETLPKLLKSVAHLMEVEGTDILMIRAMFNKFHGLTGR